MIGHWNSEEDDALHYLPLRAQVIYLRGIRRYADANGIAGLKRSISWKSLSEVAEVRPERGSKDPVEMPTRKAVRVSISQLERAGLVKQMPESERFAGLIFKCLMATQDQSAQMRKGQRRATTPQCNEGPQENPDLMRVSEEGRANEGPCEIDAFLSNEGPASPSPHELPKGSSNSCASTSRFAEFWKAYPLKKGKAEAEKKWKRKKLDLIADQILEDVRNRQERDKRWIEGYIPYGSTYVHNEVWQDEIEENPAGATTSAPGRAQPQHHKGSTHDHDRPRNRLEHCREITNYITKGLAEGGDSEEMGGGAFCEDDRDIPGSVVRLIPRSKYS